MILIRPADGQEFAVLMNPLRQWMMRLVALGMILLLQGPAMLMQEIAWARMLIEYSQDTGITRAVVDTFSGHRPCHLCELAEQLRSGDDNPAEERRDQRLRLAWADMMPTNASPDEFSRPRMVRHAPARPRSINALSRGERPPVPPPRMA